VWEGDTKWSAINTIAANALIYFFFCLVFPSGCVYLLSSAYYILSLEGGNAKYACLLGHLLNDEEKQTTVKNRNQCHQFTTMTHGVPPASSFFFHNIRTYHFYFCVCVETSPLNDACSCFDVHTGALEYCFKITP
jgi:hypothetical protein